MTLFKYATGIVTPVSVYKQKKMKLSQTNANLHLFLKNYILDLHVFTSKLHQKYISLYILIICPSLAGKPKYHYNMNVHILVFYCDIHVPFIYSAGSRDTFICFTPIHYKWLTILVYR